MLSQVELGVSLATSQLDTYLQLKGTQLEREMAAEIILRILDKVMQNAQSLNSQQVSEPGYQSTRTPGCLQDALPAIGHKLWPVYSHMEWRHNL